MSSIFKVNINDLTKIHNLNTSCFSEEERYSYHVILLIFYNNKYHYVSTDTNGKINGYIMSYFNEHYDLLDQFSNAKGRDLLTIASFAVDQNNRSKGIGSSLFEKVISEITNDKNIKGLILQVRVSNHIAIKLYEKYGFVRHQTLLKDYYNGPVEDGYLMFKNLTDDPNYLGNFPYIYNI